MDKKIDYDKPIFLHVIKNNISRAKAQEMISNLDNYYIAKGMQVIIILGEISDFRCVYSKDGIYSTNAYSLIKDLNSVEDISEIQTVLKVHFRDEIINDILI